MAEKIGEGLTIFILDDEKDICQFSSQFFAKRGFNVLTASSIDDAMDIIKKARIDIAILDIHIGKESGINVLKLIAEQQAGCQCVMLSRVDNPDIIEETSRIGAVDYLVKPLTLDKIEGAISKLVLKLRKVEK